MRNLTVRHAIKAEFTADQWQLFEKDGRDAAADDLNRALETAFAAENATEGTIHEAMSETRHKHADLGADDSEADHLIDAVIRKVLGDD